MKRVAHRPKRSYPEAPEHRCEVAVEKCPFCRGRLVSTGSREVDKYVQTLSGAVHVIGYSMRCDNEACPHPEARYHSTSGEKLSLPYQTYGLDVMAYIAQAHQGKRKQFKEIWQELKQGYGLEISEREVGKLYRRIEALQMSSQVAIDEKLRETVEKYGHLIMATDALEPDGGGPKLYVLHEIMSGTVVSLAVIEQANETHLSEWLAPYKKWQEWVTGTLSDNEQALVTAMQKTFTKAKHQLSQLHFVKNISEPRPGLAESNPGGDGAITAGADHQEADRAKRNRE